LTVPFPVPLVPDVTVIHETLLTAVHPQPLPPVTVTLPDPPFDPTLCDVGDTLKLHTPASVTVIVCPATVNVPLRAVADVLAAIV
jgi:hypothetical protein